MVFKGDTMGRLMDGWTLGFGLVGLVGTVGAFYFGLKASALERQRYRFSWEDITKGSHILAEKCIRRFHADAVITCSGPGSVVANLALIDAAKFLPVYTIIEIEKIDSHSIAVIPGYFARETPKWRLFFPDALHAITTSRLALLHDSSISGDGLMLIKRTLLDIGFLPANIRTGVLVCSQVAIESHKAPDVYVFSVELATFHFPWGEKR